MNSEPLMDVLILAALFFEQSGPSAVNEDAAIEMLEQMAATLQGLDPSSKVKFVAYLKRRASQSTTMKERADIESLASSLGLEDT